MSYKHTQTINATKGKDRENTGQVLKYFLCQNILQSLLCPIMNNLMLLFPVWMIKKSIKEAYTKERSETIFSNKVKLFSSSWNFNKITMVRPASFLKQSVDNLFHHCCFFICRIQTLNTEKVTCKFQINLIKYLYTPCIPLAKYFWVPGDLNSLLIFILSQMWMYPSFIPFTNHLWKSQCLVN